MIEAQNVNNQVVTSETLKVNETTINNFMFLYFNFGLDSVSPYQNVIYQIASMCPSEGGPAVFRARVLMERVTDTILYNDESVCMQAGYYREHYKVVNEPLITIVPNPASTSILISLLFEHDGLCNVEIYDVTGKELTSESFSCKEKMMYKDVSHLNPGIYYIKVKTDHGIRESTKLVIVR